MRKDFVQILYSLGNGNICMLLSNSKIPQSVYLIENVKNFADEVFFKQSYFFCFPQFPLLIYLLLMKSYILGQERHSFKLQFFYYYFVDVHFGQ